MGSQNTAIAHNPPFERPINVFFIGSSSYATTIPVEVARPCDARALSANYRGRSTALAYRQYNLLTPAPTVDGEMPENTSPPRSQSRRFESSCATILPLCLRGEPAEGLFWIRKNKIELDPKN